MIVDCHTQIWDRSIQWGRAGAPTVAEVSQADFSRHREAIDKVDRAIVLGFKSRYLDAEIPNRYIAECVKRNPDKVIGFAGIDPSDRDWLEELRIAQEELGLKGVTVSPSMQDFHPSDTRAMRLYEECVRRKMPVVFEQNLRNAAAKMEYARPMLLDEVASAFPELRVVVAHMGYPWVDEAIVLLGKHQHVYADVAGLLRQPWLTYNALLSAHQYGVIDKLLFGSNFPFRLPATCIEALYSLNQLSQGTNLFAIPRENLRGIVERDALALLGIEATRPRAAAAAISAAPDDEV